MENRHLYLFYGSVISLTVLLLLFAVRLYKPELLDIDVKWLTVASIPLVIALIVGKFITKFSGLGLSVEVAANEEIDNPAVLKVLKPLNAKTKSDLPELYSLSQSDLQEFNVLVFKSGQKEYYDPYAVSEYITKMPKVEYIEIVDPRDEFMTLIKIKRERFKYKDNEEFLRRFILQIERGELPGESNVTTSFVTANQTIVDTLNAVRESGKSFIAVVRNATERKLIGVVHEHALETYLANAVLRAASKKGNS
jgi:CBS domain-containing protein